VIQEGPETVLVHYAYANDHMFKLALVDYAIIGYTLKEMTHDQSHETT
jgi:hypothetical protein